MCRRELPEEIGGVRGFRGCPVRKKRQTRGRIESEMARNRHVRRQRTRVDAPIDAGEVVLVVHRLLAERLLSAFGLVLGGGPLLLLAPLLAQRLLALLGNPSVFMVFFLLFLHLLLKEPGVGVLLRTLERWIRLT